MTEPTSVAVLPYRDGREGRRYLLRRAMIGPGPEALEGEIGDGDGQRQAACRVMHSAGWACSPGPMLVPLGECRNGVTLTTALFAVNLTGRSPEGAAPSGGWLTATELAESPDPLVHVLFVRLSQQFEPALRLPSLRLVRDIDDFEVGLSDEGCIFARCPGDDCPSGGHVQATLGSLVGTAYEHIDREHRS